MQGYGPVAGEAALLGAVGTVLGSGATIVDTPVCVATGAGCVLSASGTVISADYTYAEGHYAITGVYEATIGESLLIKAALSPEVASQLYAIAGIAAGGASILAKNDSSQNGFMCADR